MRTPDEKTITFVFRSHPTKSLAMRWRAALTFPPGATGETLLPINLTDGEENPVTRGTFEFAGQKLAVADGHAQIAYSDFIRGKHDVPLWLYRPGILPIPGGLTFE